jgi:hypothetical protein
MAKHGNDHGRLVTEPGQPCGLGGPLWCEPIVGSAARPAHNAAMVDSGVIAQNLPNGGLMVQCSVAAAAECDRLMKQHMAHWRLVWLYLPLAVLVLVIIPGFIVLGRKLRATTYRQPDKQRKQLLLMFGGVIVMAAIAAPLIGFMHLQWGIDAILGGLILWGFATIAIVARTRPPTDRRR